MCVCAQAHVGISRTQKSVTCVHPAKLKIHITISLPKLLCTLQKQMQTGFPHSRDSQPKRQTKYANAAMKHKVNWWMGTMDGRICRGRNFRAKSQGGAGLAPRWSGGTEEDRGSEGRSEVDIKVEGGVPDEISSKQRDLEGRGKARQSWEEKGKLDSGLGLKGHPHTYGTWTWAYGQWEYI